MTSYHKSGELHIPKNKADIRRAIMLCLAQVFDDPVVEFTYWTTEIRMRVGQGDRGPRYFRVKIIEER